MELLTPLNADELDQLEAMLKQQQGIDLSMLDGLLTAVASSPEFLSPEVWLPEVFHRTQTELEKDNSFNQVYRFIIRHFNGIESILSQAPDKFEPLFYERDMHDSVNVIVDNWCRGYLAGIRLCQKQWQNNMEALQAWLYPILIFGGDSGKQVREESDREQILQWKAEIPLAVRTIYQFWLEYRPKQEPRLQQPFIRESAKTGRNEPCPCGSGKKFKLCCGAH